MSSPKIGLGEHGWWGLFILWAAVGYAGLAGEEQRATTLYQRAKPLSANDPTSPVVVTGLLSHGELVGGEVKPGRYRAVLQASEVYAWAEYETTTIGQGQTTKRLCNLQWTSTPKDPSTFSSSECRTQPLFKKSRELADEWPKDASLEGGGRQLAIDLSEVEWPLLDKPVPPKLSELIRGEAAITDTEGDSLLVYASKDCRTETPAAGCERVRVSVRTALEGEATFIGKVDGDRLTKFEDTLKGSAGNKDALMAAFSFESSFDGLENWLLRMASFAGIWVGLALVHRPARHLLRGIRKLAEASTTIFVVSVGSGLGLVAVLIRSLAVLLGFGLVAALIVASRAAVDGKPRSV